MQTRLLGFIAYMMTLIVMCVVLFCGKPDFMDNVNGLIEAKKVLVMQEVNMRQREVEAK